MLLDCDAGTLAVWVNGERKGVLVRRGMTDGAMLPTLEGKYSLRGPPAEPLRWAVDVLGTSVAIDGPLPPPEDATAE